MKQNPSVVVLSAWGRGHWLAAELKNIGFEVLLVDFTANMGRFTPEDIEGPFGFFQTESLLESQMARLDYADYAEEVEDGFTLWLKSGPVDFRGPLTPFLYEKIEQSAEVRAYIEKYETFANKERETAIAKIMKSDFYQRWLAHLAQNISAPVMRESTAALENVHPLPLFNRLMVRRVTRRGFDKSLEWVKSKGVQVYEQVKLQALQIGEPSVLKLNVNNNDFELVADQMILSLTSSELEMLQPSVRRQVFQNVSRPEWGWQRFRFDFDGAHLFATLPKHFLLIEDLALPWTHSNAIMAQKTLTDGQMDAWVRLPYDPSFEKTYIEERGKEITEVLQSRLPGVHLRLVEYPAQYTNGGDKNMSQMNLGVYNAKDLSDLKPLKKSNIHYDSPEFWQTFEWSGRFNFNRDVFLKILDWKNQYDENYKKHIEKEKAREEAQKKREQK